MIPSYALESTTLQAGKTAKIVFVTPTQNQLTLTLTITGTDIGGQSGSYTQTVTVAQGVSSYTFTVSTSLLDYMPSAKSKTITLTLTDGTNTKTGTCTLTANGSDYAPTGCVVSMEPLSTSVPAAWGKYVEGHSKCKLTISTAATARYGAGIAYYDLYMNITGGGASLDTKRVNGQITAPYTWTPTMNESDMTGPPVISVVAYDTRGNYALFQTAYVAMTAYAVPSVDAMSVTRCDANGDADDAGTYAMVRVTPSISSVDSLNALQSVTCKYRRKGVSAWTSAGSLAEDPNEPGVYFAVIGGGNLTANKNWQIDAIVTDLVDESEQIRQLSIAYMEMHIAKGGGAWAFGGVADTPGSLHIWGGLKLDTALPISSGGTGATNAGAARINLGMANDDGAITYSTTSTYIGTTYAGRVYRRGSMCCAYLHFEKSSTATGGNFRKIATLPAGFLPATTITQAVPIQSASTAYMVAIEIDTDGNVNMYGNNSQTGRIRASICYPLRSQDY